MAIFNEILAPRLPRYIQRIFNMKGPQSTPQVSGEVIPVFPFFSGVENRVMEQWQRYAQVLNLAAGGAGNFSQWRFRNPQKNAVAVFEKIVISNNNAAAATYLVLVAGNISTDLPNLQTPGGNQLDLRGQGQPMLIMSFANNSAVGLSGIAIFDGVIAPNISQDIIITENQELMLALGATSGAALHIQSPANTALLATAIWRERVLEESEQVGQ